jgi:hypothetical protein
MGVIGMGGAAIRARYKKVHLDQGVDADQRRSPATSLREVLADQHYRGHRANVSAWHESAK